MLRSLLTFCYREVSQSASWLYLRHLIVLTAATRPTLCLRNDCSPLANRHHQTTAVLHSLNLVRNLVAGLVTILDAFCGVCTCL
jgi:hypothetical protein